MKEKKKFWHLIEGRLSAAGYLTAELRDRNPLGALFNSCQFTDTDYALKQLAEKIRFFLEKEEPSFSDFS